MLIYAYSFFLDEIKYYILIKKYSDSWGQFSFNVSGKGCKTSGKSLSLWLFICQFGKISWLFSYENFETK